MSPETVPVFFLYILQFLKYRAFYKNPIVCYEFYFLHYIRSWRKLNIDKPANWISTSLCIIVWNNNGTDTFNFFLLKPLNFFLFFKKWTRRKWHLKFICADPNFGHQCYGQCSTCFYKTWKKYITDMSRPMCQFMKRLFLKCNDKRNKFKI